MDKHKVRVWLAEDGERRFDLGVYETTTGYEAIEKAKKRYANTFKNLTPRWACQFEVEHQYKRPPPRPLLRDTTMPLPL